ITSALFNRQDGSDEFSPPTPTRGDSGKVDDPRRAGAFEDRVLLPRLSQAEGDRLMLGYEAQRSQMTVTAAADHVATAPMDASITTHASDDQARWTIQCTPATGETVRVEKYVSYHSSRGVDPGELGDRCSRTLQRAVVGGVKAVHEAQRAWFDAFWERSDVTVTEQPAAAGRLDGDPVALQQAIRFNLFSLAQATARSDGQGVAAKGVTGSGYEGHYFWDTEIYVMPFLTFTSPDVARNVLQFRVHMLPMARARAAEMAIQGAQFPWRTINGEEASAYYAAGTAQVHIDADVSYAMVKYAQATADEPFMRVGGIDVLVETARLWSDIGFVRDNGEPSFQIHGVTGPDEYTTVVNNNLFTNVMARYNLEQAVAVLTALRERDLDEYALTRERLNIADEEIEWWAACARGMRIPYDDHLGIHPQDDFFLHREVWDLESTPPELHPLLLHYHPLVIYRFQVLKQADVVLALFLQGDRFTAEEKLRDFEYYTPITTGDSTLSAVVEAIVAAEVGHHRAAREYFHEALYCDLANLHANSADGIHIASAGGVWAGLVNGFGGMRHYDNGLHFDPRLPEGWDTLSFPLQWRGHLLQVAVTQDAITFTSRADDAATAEMYVRGQAVRLDAGGVVRVPLHGQGDRIDRPLIAPPKGRRPDGTRLAAHLPPPIPEPLTYLHDTGSMPVIRDPDEG
ncbi:MAG TPA: glycosyl hydrolase family 65 protein, partial [Nocardioides sp.]|nr:glycosyl hydrolase family 65 protein [Nocardioides sp.]